MIKETCSCGATLEYSPSGQYPLKEGEVAAAWRKDHKHESQTVAPERLRSSIDQYILNEDYVFNGDNEPVWISTTRSKPLYWGQWLLGDK